MPPQPQPHNRDADATNGATGDVSPKVAAIAAKGVAAVSVVPPHAHLTLPGAAAYSAAPAALNGAAPAPANGAVVSPKSPSTPCGDERIADEEHFSCCGAVVEPYLTRGYRHWCRGSVLKCALSIFQRHNETVNIWSHGLGSLYFIRAVYLTYHSEWRRRHMGYPAANRVLWHGMACAATFGISTVAHTFCAYSPHASKVLFSADRAMIAILLMICTHLSSGMRWSSQRAVVVQTRKRIFWLTNFTGLLAALTLGRESMFNPATKVLVMGAQLALSSMPVISECLRYSSLAPALSRSVAVDCFWVMALAGIGGFLYASRIPEKWFPGRFDLFGASHQLMHFFVVASAHRAFHGTKRWADAQGVARDLVLNQRK